MAIANETAKSPPNADAHERRLVRLTIPARAEFVGLCRLALVGLARMRPMSDELVGLRNGIQTALAIHRAASDNRVSRGSHYRENGIEAVPTPKRKRATLL